MRAIGFLAVGLVVNGFDGGVWERVLTDYYEKRR